MFDFPGIYKIQSIIKPERFYVGSAVSLQGRQESHMSSLKSNNHKNGKLQNHYNKYGKEDLMFSIIKCCQNRELIEAEQYFLDEMQPFFNIAKIAKRSAMGRKMSEETKKKISESKKGKSLSEAHKQLLSEMFSGEDNPFYGKKHTKESIRKMSEAKKGTVCSEGVKRKKSESMMGEKNHFYEKHHTLETLEKMRKPKSEEHKAKIREENNKRCKSRWMYEKGTEKSIIVLRIDIEKYIKKGWLFGMQDNKKEIRERKRK